jgi:hypothetical protein
MASACWDKQRPAQYEDIDSSSTAGCEDRVKRSRHTVNKRRRLEGGPRTCDARGNPNRGLDKRTRDEIYNRARELHIRGRSGMSKAELLEAIRHARSRR